LDVLLDPTGISLPPAEMQISIPTKTIVVNLLAGNPVSWTVPSSKSGKIAILSVSGSSNTFISRTGITANAVGVNGAGGGYILETVGSASGGVYFLYEVCHEGDLIWFYNAGAAVNVVIYAEID
jgi:hypothetical protein